MASISSIHLKRVYEPPSKKDGKRILVDRLWPRGIKKVDAEVDLWLKDIAPSNELRHWFGHDPERWEEFRARYIDELHESAPSLKELRALAAQGPITLLFAARDEEHNNAVVLRDVLLKHR
jgi:uncharacterized protein YeaO (DUF488 family)